MYLYTTFTDGRDCDPISGKGFIIELEKNLFLQKLLLFVQILQWIETKGGTE